MSDEQLIRLATALRRIAAYDTPEKLRRTSEKQWGLPYEDAIEMAYENIQQEARNALRGFRMPRAARERERVG